MRKRFLVLSSVAALGLATLAGPASADTTVTTTVKCSGAYVYSNSYTVAVETLPPSLILPFSQTYSFQTLKGPETCTITLS
jgi:hypothetical protein